MVVLFVYANCTKIQQNQTNIEKQTKTQTNQSEISTN